MDSSDKIKWILVISREKCYELLWGNAKLNAYQHNDSSLNFAFCFVWIVAKPTSKTMLVEIYLEETT